MVGLRGSDELQRRGIYVATVPIRVERWPADPKARKVLCLALVDQPIVGTLEGLGMKPLQRARVCLAVRAGIQCVTGR